MKLNLLSILLLLSFASCDNDKEEQPVLIPLISYEISVDIRVEDSTGIDLLKRENVGHYNASDIVIFGSDDLPNAISIQKYSPETDYYSLKLALNYPKPDIEKGKQYSVELISKLKFGNKEMDIIKGLYEIKYHDGIDTSLGTGSGYTVVLQKAWFNNRLIYDKLESQDINWELSIIIKDPNS